MRIRNLLAAPLAAALLCAAPPVANRAPLAKTPYSLLPLGSVKPQGWLKRQLRIQADGLGGHIEEIWPDLGPNSGWLGGKGESWERGPYYLDGLIPLAFLLDDPVLVARAEKWVNWTLDHQLDDGRIGPVVNTDWWPKFVILKALTQYQEATGDTRVPRVMKRYFTYQASQLAANPLKEWAIMRWQDEVLSLIWLYNRTGDASLLDLSRQLKAQGFYWPDQFRDFQYKSKVSKADSHLKTHGVNNSQALKTAAVWWQVTNDPKTLEDLYIQFDALDRYHLQVNGMHSADEHYAGKDPAQGTELCSVLEAMFSLEHMVAATADPRFADRLERLAYNAQPATYSKDMWAHQYDQQANQVLVTKSDRAWTTNGPDSNLYGLEPNFGCCTANMHQGWPKFVANLWMATAQGGLAAVAYGPSVVKTTAGGTDVRVSEETEYPFRSKITLKVDPAKPAEFPLELRIPAWATESVIKVNGAPVSGAKPGSFFTLKRTWKPGDVVELDFPMPVRLLSTNEGWHVERGPLVFSLKIGEHWTKIKDRGPASDYEVYPTTPWNYGLSKDDPKFEVEERPLGDYPFSPEGAPVAIRAAARRVPSWMLVNDSAGPVPGGSGSVNVSTPLEQVTLIPYGAAKLRVTVFPQVVPGKKEKQ